MTTFFHHKEHMSQSRYFVGIDLGNTNHAVCVSDSHGGLREFSSDHSYKLIELLKTATNDAAASTVLVGLEDANNVVADTLMELGYQVFTANPKCIDQFRGRESASGAKSDARDARVIARALATDLYAYHQHHKRSDEVVSLTSMAASLQRLVDQRTQTANQLRAVVQRCYPMLLTLCSGADEAWFWSLLLKLRFGTPSLIGQISRADIGEVLHDHRKRAIDSDDVLAVLKKPMLLPFEMVAKANALEVKSLICVLREVDKQLKLVQQERDAQVKAAIKHDDEGVPSNVAILRSMPGIGVQTATVLIGCVDLLQRGELNAVRAMSGVAPVTKQSGKMHVVSMRRGCNVELRNAMFHVAQAAIRVGRFKVAYDEKKARGMHHCRALRSIGDMVLRVLSSMLKSRTMYDSTKPQAA